MLTAAHPTGRPLTLTIQKLLFELLYMRVWYAQSHLTYTLKFCIREIKFVLILYRVYQKNYKYHNLYARDHTLEFKWLCN